MARKKIKMEEAGIDKLELFLQNYFKQLLVGIAAVIVLFVVSYGGYSYYGSSRANKANLVGELESTLATVKDVKEFIDIERSVPFLKDYIGVKASESFVVLGDDKLALEALNGIGGKYLEIRDGLAFDLGATIPVEQFIMTGKMKPLWYYRQALTAEPQDRQAIIAAFKAKYPDDKLLDLLVKWGI